MMKKEGRKLYGGRQSSGWKKEKTQVWLASPLKYYIISMPFS
jgi:hypothetical protein